MLVISGKSPRFERKCSWEGVSGWSVAVADVVEDTVEGFGSVPDRSIVVGGLNPDVQLLHGSTVAQSMGCCSESARTRISFMSDQSGEAPTSCWSVALSPPNGSVGWGLKSI